MGGECPCFRAVCHCWKYAWIVDLSLQVCPCITLENIAVLGECFPSGRESSLNLIVFVFASGAVSLSQIDVGFNVLDLGIVVFSSSPLASTCSSSDPDFHFHQLIPVAFVVVGVVYYIYSAYEYVVGEAKMTKIFAVYLQASGFPSQLSEYALKCCREQLGRYGISVSYSCPDVDLFAFFV